MAAVKSRSGPAHRAEYMPGALPRPETQRPRIVGQGREIGMVTGRAGFQTRVRGKSAAGFLRFRQAQVHRRHHANVKRRQQCRDFADLARVVARHYDRVIGKRSISAGGHERTIVRNRGRGYLKRSASLCKRSNAPMPSFANAISDWNSLSLKGSPSAVP